MDTEKFNYLWAEDSGWVLRPRGDSYLIHRYNEDGTMSAMVFEDDDLLQAIINKMKSAGIKIITDTEADELFKRMQTIQRGNAEKSKKLIIQAEQALKNNQMIKNALRELLDNLDKVENKHPEIHDTMVREILCDTILDSFVFGSTTDDIYIPSDNEYAMFSNEGNEAVHKALVQFVTHPEVEEARRQLAIPEERLVIFQDDEVESSNGSHYDSYFGWVSSL